MQTQNRILILALFVILFSSHPAPAQLTVNSVSLNAGTIRSLSAESWTNNHWKFYPELQLGGDLFVAPFRWTMYWAYWSDGFQKVPFYYWSVYSYSSHIIGARVQVVLPRAPLGVFVGISQHFIARTYLGGTNDFPGKPLTDISANATTFELGLNGEVELCQPLALRLEVHQLFPLGDRPFEGVQKDRRAYTGGIAVKF